MKSQVAMPNEVFSESFESRTLDLKAVWQHSEDPFSYVTRLVNTAWRLWMLRTYPFISVGDGFRIHHTCDLRRAAASRTLIGTAVWLERDVWINIPIIPQSEGAVIVLDDRCRIGRRSVISAKNHIHIGKDVIFGPSVLVMDHNHEFEDISTPISEQGVTEGGTIFIDEGCWIGHGTAIVCNKGKLTIGRNSVIGANSVVTKSVPPYSVVTGNPGRVVKQFDPSSGNWVLGRVVPFKDSPRS